MPEPAEGRRKLQVLQKCPETVCHADKPLSAGMPVLLKACSVMQVPIDSRCYRYMTLKTWQRSARSRRPVHTMQQHTLQVCNNMFSLLHSFCETTALCICSLCTFPATSHTRAEHVYLILSCISYISQTQILSETCLFLMYAILTVLKTHALQAKLIWYFVPTATWWTQSYALL